MNDGSRDSAPTGESVPSTMANRRLESLRRLNEMTAAGQARRPLSPNSQKLRLEERIRNLQRKEGKDMGGLVRQPLKMAGPDRRLGALERSDGSSANANNGVLPRSNLPPIRNGLAAGKDDNYRPAEMERKTSELSVRSFASEGNDHLVDNERNLEGTGNDGNSEHNRTFSSHSNPNSSHHSSTSLQRPSQGLVEQLDDIDEAHLIQQEDANGPGPHIRRPDNQGPPVVRPGGLQHPQNIATLNRKIALQQLVQQKLLQQQQQLAQRHHQEREVSAQLDRRAMPAVTQQERALSARDLLIQRKIQQQRELNMQRKAQVAQQLQQELSQRQMLPSQQPPPVSQSKGNRLTAQQQQILLLQRELKLKRELGRSPQGPPSNAASASPHVGHRPFTMQARRQLSTKSLQGSQNLSFHGRSREAPSPFPDYSHHQPQEYRDMHYYDGLNAVADAYHHPQFGPSSVYADDESVYQSSISQRELMHGGVLGHGPARMSSIRSISTSGSTVPPRRVHPPPPPPPPPPAEKMVEVSPDFWVRLRGADETWAAVEHDFYSPVTCFGCNLELCCIQDADFVLCPTCRVVSPMNGIGGGSRQNGRDGGVGLGFTYESLMRWQSEILVARQQRQVYNGGVFAS